MARRLSSVFSSSALFMFSFRSFRRHPFIKKKPASVSKARVSKPFDLKRLKIQP
jgi:hypothetical protein